MNKTEISKEEFKKIQRLQQLNQLERLQQLSKIKTKGNINNLEIKCGSYLEYEYQEGDVVYCDPPYEGTAEYSGGFDHREFYDWVAEQPFRIYFSSYEISDNRFFKIWKKRKITTLSQSSNGTERIEVLYSNKEDKITLF